MFCYKNYMLSVDGEILIALRLIFFSVFGTCKMKQIYIVKYYVFFFYFNERL